MSLKQFLLAAALLAAAAPLSAKPIAFADGYTAMYEYGAGTMQEAQVFYAPRYWYSAGAGYLRLIADDESFAHDIAYARVNYLVKRWNLTAAQGNVFAYGGFGGARSNRFDGTEDTWNAGAQADYETRRIYASLKADYQHSAAFAHRIDTLQLGVAPYLHEYGGLATWLVLQGRTYTGDIYDGVEGAALVRLFGARAWGSVWLEAGVSSDGKVQTMVMFNF